MPKPAPPWGLTDLLTAAQAPLSKPERHLWLMQLLRWIRRPAATEAGRASAADGGPASRPHAAAEPARTAAATMTDGPASEPGAPDTSAPVPRTPLPVLRIRQLLKLLEQNPPYRDAVQRLLSRFWSEVDAAGLFADFGFTSRGSLPGELWRRVLSRLIPPSPDSQDLAEVFELVFEPGDAAWIDALDDDTLARIASLCVPEGPDAPQWRLTLRDAFTMLVGAVHAAGFTPALRQRMSPKLIADRPFRQLVRESEHLRQALEDDDHEAAMRHAVYLRALLDRCREAAASITLHLEEHGVSVNIVLEMDQLRARALRIEQILDCLLEPRPYAAVQRLLLDLVQALGERRGIGPLLKQQYSQMARQVAERSAEAGSHYITRDVAAYGAMLARALGGGAVLAFTTYLKFGLLALGLSIFFSGLAAGINYAVSFVVIMALHLTVATKQPAMTAPALAAQLATVTDDASLQAFVDEVADLIRTQSAGIIGNVCAVVPAVLLLQWLWRAAGGGGVIGTEQAAHALDSLNVVGPTLLFAAFTGVLLFASSLIAGWTENWFVFHRLQSIITWHPRVRERLGELRAARWAQWWRTHISALTGNVALGLMLGLAPAVAQFFGVPLEVRHVTLSAGQVAAAAGALGPAVLGLPVFWACVIGVVGTAALNVLVSFTLAFRVAMRSRRIRPRDKRRVYAAIRQRLWRRPWSFVLPPRRPGVPAPGPAA